MKRKTSKLILIVAALYLASFALFTIEEVKATTENYSIEEVNHTIQVMYNGYILINDTIRLNGTANNGFLIGFPYEYGRHILRCTAHKATEAFPTSLNVPFANGFYGIQIDFPQGTPQTFSVLSVLSNDLLHRESQNVSRLSFPTYPGLAKEAGKCNVSILLPDGSKYVGGTVDALTYNQEKLEPFTPLSKSGNVTFSPPEAAIQIVDVNKLKRKMKLSGVGEIEGSDTYYITNRDTQEIDSLRIIVPENASHVSAHDQLGRSLSVSATAETDKYDMFFRLPLDIEESSIFTVRYRLPTEVYVEQKGTRSFDLKFPLYQHLDYYIDHSSVTFVLPEGGKILSFENVSAGNTYGVIHDVFQEELVVNSQSVLSVDSFSLGITYEYDVLWLSFRSTLWMWALTTVGCAIAVVWSRPKAAVPIVVPEAGAAVSSEEIKSFVDVYERRRKTIPKLKSLKTRAQKGKISRRRYKVQRKTLETRLKTFSRKVTDFEEKMRAAGGRYRDLIRRLEVAETEINEVEANIRSIQVRHRRGELSLGAYRKLLSEYEQRKDKAQTTINEILIRLREEIH